MGNTYNRKVAFYLDLAYIIAILQIVLYIVQKQRYMNTSVNILWFSAIIAFFIIFIQIGYGYPIIRIFLKIIILSVLLHMLFIPPVGLLGSDAQYDYDLIKLIANYGWSLDLRSLVAPWPIMHIYVVISSFFLGVPLVEAARFIPSMISVVAIMFIYCLANYFYKNNYYALSSITLLSVAVWDSFFHSLPIRETVGVMILFLALYCYVAGTEKRNIILILLSIILGALLTLCHHFTAFVYIFLLFSLYLMNQGNKFLIPKISNKYRIDYLLLIIVCATSYWYFVSNYILINIKAVYDTVFLFGESNSTIIPNNLIYPPLINFQTYVFSYSRRFTFIFVAILLSLRILHLKNLKRFELAFLSYAFIIFCFWFLTSGGLLNLTIAPERLQLFAWLFLIIVLGKYENESYSINIARIQKLLFILFLASYIMMNITEIQPYVYDPSIQPLYVDGSTRIMFLPEEYAAANWFKGEGTVQGDRALEDLMNSNKNAKLRTDLRLFNGDLSISKYTDWIILRKEMLKRFIGTKHDNYYFKTPLNLSIEFFKNVNQYSGLEKVYMNGEVEIFKSN